jgi:hypothetical protein
VVRGRSAKSSTMVPESIRYLKNNFKIMEELGLLEAEVGSVIIGVIVIIFVLSLLIKK